MTLKTSKWCIVLPVPVTCSCLQLCGELTGPCNWDMDISSNVKYWKYLLTELHCSDLSEFICVLRIISLSSRSIHDTFYDWTECTIWYFIIDTVRSSQECIKMGIDLFVLFELPFKNYSFQHRVRLWERAVKQTRNQISTFPFLNLIFWSLLKQGREKSYDNEDNIKQWHIYHN